MLYWAYETTPNVIMSLTLSNTAYIGCSFAVISNSSISEEEVLGQTLEEEQDALTLFTMEMRYNVLC